MSCDSEGHSEPSQTSKMELFAKIANDYKNNKADDIKTHSKILLHQCPFFCRNTCILNPLCSCSIEVETTTRYFLRCRFYNSSGAILMNDLENVSIFFYRSVITT